jgi:hypothetical protein
MPSQDLIQLTSKLSRLTKRRYRTVRRLKMAHMLLRIYAAQNELSEEWCDSVLLIFLDD